MKKIKETLAVQVPKDSNDAAKNMAIAKAKQLAKVTDPNTPVDIIQKESKITEMARSAVRYEVGDESKTEELKVTQAAKSRVNDIIRYITTNGPTSIIELAKGAFESPVRQQQINPMMGTLVSLGILKPSSDSQEIFNKKQQTHYSDNSAEEPEQDPNSFFRHPGEKDEPETTEDEPSDDEIEKNISPKLSVSTEESDALLDYLDTKDKINKITANIRKFPQEVKVVAQAIHQGKDIPDATKNMVNKKYTKIAGDDMPNSSNILGQISNLYVLRDKVQGTLTDLESKWPSLANRQEKINEANQERLKKLANINKW